MFLTFSSYPSFQIATQQQRAIAQTHSNRNVQASSDCARFSSYSPIKSQVRFGYQDGHSDSRPWAHAPVGQPFTRSVEVHETYQSKKYRDSPHVVIISGVLPGMEPTALARGIAECHRESWQSNPPLDAPEPWVRTRPKVFVSQERIEEYARDLQNENIFWMIATCHGAKGSDFLSNPDIAPVVGFIQAQRVSNDKMIMELPFCYVLSHRQRQGLGSLMMSKLLRYCLDDPNIKELTAMVQLKSPERNDKALQFYRWIGFDFAKDKSGNEKSVEVYRLGNDESGYYDSKQQWITLPRSEFPAALQRCEQKAKKCFKKNNPNG